MTFYHIPDKRKTPQKKSAVFFHKVLIKAQLSEWQELPEQHPPSFFELQEQP